jgi:exonuclease SbcC
LERSRLLAEQASAEAASAKQERDEVMRSVKEVQRKVEGCAKAAESARTSLAEARMAIGRLEEARQAEREAEAAVADAETLAAQASEAADAELTALRAHVRDLETAAAPAKEVAERAREVGERLRQAEAEVVERAAELAARERDLAAAEEAVIRLGEIEAELAGLSECGQLAQVLIKAAGPSGVPALVVASSVGELEETANDVLDRLSHGTMHLGIRCSRPSKSRSGTSIETLDVVLADPSGAERAWATWSGGERFRADLALRIALARVVAARSAVEAPRWLVIDEGFGALDDDGVASFGNVLADLSKEVDLVLAVTHSPEVAQLFPRRLEVRPGWPALEVA